MTFGKTKSPVALVMAGSDRVPRLSLISTTVAPGMTPPCASLTVPDTEPVVTWADAGIVASSAPKAKAQTLRILLIAPSFL